MTEPTPSLLGAIMGRVRTETQATCHFPRGAPGLAALHSGCLVPQTG